MRRLAIVVLAAGRGLRFGGPKLLARLDGRPLLAHALGAVVRATPRLAHVEEIVVVLGDHAVEIEDALRETGLIAPPVRLVRNRQPARGLASSLQVGLSALSPGMDGALVVLGDQPRLAPSAVEALVDAWAGGDATLVVPRYRDGGGPNPVVIDRSAWPLAFELEGDRGMGPVIAAHPELVRIVDLPGANPDVDTPADLDALALRPS